MKTFLLNLILLLFLALPVTCVGSSFAEFCSLTFQRIVRRAYTPNPRANDFLRAFGLSPTSVVYRYVKPEFLINHEDGSLSIKGTPSDEVVGATCDIYSENAKKFRGREFYRALTDRKKIPTIGASELNVPILFVSPLKGFVPTGRVLVAIRVGDLLEVGGRPYPDRGATPGSALIFTVPDDSEIRVTRAN